MTDDDLTGFYRVLDLEPGASIEQIKRAWRDLTKVWHPDRFEGDPRMEAKAEEKLKAINGAYERLTAGRLDTPGPSKGTPRQGATASERPAPPHARPAPPPSGSSPPSQRAQRQVAPSQQAPPKSNVGSKTSREAKAFWILFWLSAVLIFFQELPKSGLEDALLGGAIAGALNGAIGVAAVRIARWFSKVSWTGTRRAYERLTAGWLGAPGRPKDAAPPRPAAASEQPNPPHARQEKPRPGPPQPSPRAPAIGSVRPRSMRIEVILLCLSAVVIVLLVSPHGPEATVFAVAALILGVLGWMYWHFVLSG
jgi:hypothetical protein